MFGLFGFRVRKEDIEAVDGDTIWHMAEPRKYRLIGYDSPETMKAKTEHEWGWGTYAKDKLDEAIERAQRLVIKPKLFGQRWTRDSRLARLFIDGEDVKDIAIRDGWAVAWTGGKRPNWGALDDDR